MLMTNQTKENNADALDEVLAQLDTPAEDMDEILIDAETGEIIEDGDDEPKLDLESAPFGSNLVSLFTEDELKDIGGDICDKVNADKESRKEWYGTLKKGLASLGIYSPDDTDTGVARVSHPMLVEAATQFQARAAAETLPPGGPVKAQILGRKTPEALAQADRVAAYMNYQLTIEDRSYYEARDQMLFLLPFTGSEFDKQYHDPTTRRVTSRWVRSDHFIAPYNTESLETASRYTHEIHMAHNAFRRVVASGFYVSETLDDDDTKKGAERVKRGDGKEAELTEILTDLDGQEKPGGRADEDGEHVLYECHIDYDLPGTDEAFAFPFIITVDSETEEVIGIYRNWREADENKIKRVWFTHKKFLPGFGFYGFGLLHCIGNLGEAATEILNILLDSGAFATLQGGFKSKDAKLPGDITLEPGTWIDTEMSAEELAKAFYTPPFKEPSQVLNALLGTIVELGQRFAATTETMVGDAATTGPVGTMVAQIEQGSKVFSGIHRRLHRAFGEEFAHIAELNGENLPEMYPYLMPDGEQNVLRADFDGRVDIMPVSDPNIFSSAQRIAMAQTALQLAQSMPDIADRREAAVGLLTAMRFPNPEQVFPKKREARRIDPVSEVASILLGRPVKAFFEQNHKAHNTVHQGHLQALPEQFQPLMQAHIMEHEAMHMYQQMQLAQQQAAQQAGQANAQAMQQWSQQAQIAQAQGLPLPPQPQPVQAPAAIPAANWGADNTEDVFKEIPLEEENQIALQVAALVQKDTQAKQQAEQAAEAAKQPAPKAPPPDPQMEENRKDMALQATIRREDAKFQASEGRKNQALAIDTDRDDALAGLSPALVKQAGQFISAAGLNMSPRELAVLSKTLGRDFSEVVAAVSRMSMQGQGGGQTVRTAEFVNRDTRFM